MSFLSKMLSDDSGNPSSLRLPFLIWEFVLVAAFVCVTGCQIASHFWKLADFDPSKTYMAIAGLFTANRTSKQAQKMTEDNGNQSTQPRS